jgi:hypothetical protein
MNDTINTKITALKNQGTLQDKLLVEEVLRIVREEVEGIEKRRRELLLRERFAEAMAAWMENQVRSEILPWVNKWSFKHQFDSFSARWWAEHKQ